MFVIKVLPSPLVQENKAGYEALRMASTWDQSFFSFSSWISLLFTIYTYDLPLTVGRKFAYADDLAFLHYGSDWQALQWTLAQDMATLFFYLYKWKLKRSTTKTVSAAFLFYSKEAEREFNIFVNGQAQPFCVESTYLGIKLDRALTFRPHLKSLRKKLASRVGLLQQLAGSSWDAMPQYFAQPSLPRSILRLSTVHLFRVSMFILALLTS